jgi:hypothetical protein
MSAGRLIPASARHQVARQRVFISDFQNYDLTRF